MDEKYTCNIYYKVFVMLSFGDLLPAIVLFRKEVDTLWS